MLFSAIVVILCVMSLLLGNMLLSLPVLLLLVLNQIDLIGVMQLANVHMNGARARIRAREKGRPAARGATLRARDGRRRAPLTRPLLPAPAARAPQASRSSTW